MPGPMSAPNGDKTLVVDHKKRELLLSQGKLYTGKTEKQQSK
ncbi:MAG TPA: hypothetical protein VIY48_16580 [Candidatus Paceibacterota bacterium]